MQFENTHFSKSIMSIIQCIGGFVAILIFLYIYYWRRNRDEFVPINWPIIGMLPTFLHHLSDFHDYATIVLKRNGGTYRFQGPWFTNTSFVGLADPMNVTYITKKNFGNYAKGSKFHDIFEVLGGSIFNSDSNDVWKQEKTMFHLVLGRKSFKNMFQHSIQKKVDDYLIPFLNDVSEAGAQVDLQDAFNRFTFDSSCLILFGFDPNCLPNKFNQLREIPYKKSLPVMEEVIFYRHFIPSSLWKLQKWLNVGQEKKFKVAQEYLDRFLYESITFSLGEEQSKCSNEEMDQCFLGMVKALKKEGYGKGEISEKYLRDTALTMVFAGNGSISSALSWFFWLLSTYPIVEEKIIQEIKDNWLTQEDNRIILRDVVLDKLVYLHGAICETLRLYPPIPFEHICAIKSDILPSGERISPNTSLMYSMYSMGRMEQLWGEDCMEFKPERWISERGDIIHVPSYKFITFNTGPRICIGKDLSFIQMKMVAAALLRKFHIQVVEGHLVTPRLSVFLRMKHGLKVEVSKRSI
ncbi:putative cytochrome P450 [Medicago truncatula]|uniref:Putative cytochrome P450 n=1 Tax=Medicago truncatula TaxID=3880 RepID=A0A396JNJ0_MEDTR|nr:alkane hydroxylase MAH1 [Medicago truncatula]RHN78251.1 putative cytochrome P450 [Medicago truncatula]